MIVEGDEEGQEGWKREIDPSSHWAGVVTQLAECSLTISESPRSLAARELDVVANTCNLSTGEVEAEAEDSKFKVIPWLQSKFKTSLRYVRP